MKINFDKLKRWINAFMYSIPYAMKGANDEIFGNESKGVQGSTISQEVSDKRVANHMLKGEVTQEVAELRYRTYKVADESEKYTYVGNGVIVKKDGTVLPSNRTKYTFSQENSLMCASINEEFKRMNDYGEERYRFEIMYEFSPRFKIEQHASSVDVKIDDTDGTIQTTFHFSSFPNKYLVSSKPFLKSLDDYILRGTRGEFIDSMKSLSFSTYKANGEDDLVNYSFINPVMKKATCSDDLKEYLVTYEWESYIRMPLDLPTKYYSKSMDEKYARKERKDVDVEMVASTRKRYCALCGKEVSVYDGDVLEFNGMEVLCNDCLKKMNETNGEKNVS